MWNYTPNDSANGVVVPLRSTSSWDNAYVDVGTYLPGCDGGGAEAPLGNSWTAAVAATAATTVAMTSAQSGTVTKTLAAFDLLNVARCNDFVGQNITVAAPYSMWVGTAGIQGSDIRLRPDSKHAPFLQRCLSVRLGAHLRLRASGQPHPCRERAHTLSHRGICRWHVANVLPSCSAGSLRDIATRGGDRVWSDSPFVVASQDAAHPIFMLAHMVDPRDFDPGCDEPDAGTFSSEGSNAMHAVPAVEKWGVHYDMFLPINYPASELVVVRRLGSPDVTVDCAGIVTGWQSIDSSFEYARLPISSDANGVFNPQVYAAGTCDNGVRSVSSAAPFGVTAYGWISSPFGKFLEAGAFNSIGSSYAYAPLSPHPTISMGDGGPR